MLTKDDKARLIQHWLKRKRRHKRRVSVEAKKKGQDLPAIIIAPSKKAIFNYSFIKVLDYPDYIFYVLNPNYELIIGKANNYDKKVNYVVSYVNKRKSGAVATFPAYLCKLLDKRIQFGTKIYAKSIINPSNRGVRIVFAL